MSRWKNARRFRSFQSMVLLLGSSFFLPRIALAVSPPVPACASSTSLGSTNLTAVAIPDNNPTGVTSTILVSGQTGTVWDVDLTTAITHTFNSDLDVTLTSPAGTVVTITTGNAGSNDDVFNGTVWDDDADPDSQIPYSGNPNIVTDHVYTNGVLASPLTPEEPLAAFIGEDPNGTWTLKAVDHLGGDSGTINSWGLTFTLLTTPLVNTTTTPSNSTPAPIPDNNPTGVTSTILVSGAGTFLTDVNLTTAITHTFASDLDVTLTSPAGTVVTITTDNAASNDNVYAGTTWDDSADPDSQIPYAVNPNIATDHTYANGVTATPLTPEEPLGAFIGEDPNGTWTLKVVDDLGGDTGTLNSWALSLTTSTCPPDLAITKTDGITSAAPGQGVVYTIVASNVSGVAVTGATVGDTFAAPLTNVSWTCTASSGSSCGASGTGNISDTVNLLAGGTATYTVNATISPLATGSVSNTATVAVPSGLTDADQSNNSDTDTDTLTAGADVEVSKVGPGSAVAGGNLVYSVVVTNNGPSAAQNVVLADTLPPGTTFVSQNQLSGPVFTLGNTSSSINDTIATLASGASATFEITVSFSGAPGTSISNTATVSATTADTVSNNNSSTAVTVVSAQIPVLSPAGTAGMILGILAVGLFALRRRP